MRIALPAILVLGVLAAGCSTPPKEEETPLPVEEAAKVETGDVRFVRQNPPAGEAASEIVMHPNGKWSMTKDGKTTSGTVVVGGGQAVFTILDSPEGKPKPPYDKFGGTYDGTTLTISPSNPPVVYRRA